MRWPGSRSGRPTPGLASDVIVKAVILFLVSIGVLAMFGKLRMPSKRALTGKCPSCGRYRIGKGRCSCGEAGR
ncbi:hypothetical protein GCM10011360_02780 [Primorskyibacter flagellatus]|uniref:Uncharacterized protein n=1 Tax=Primorskyibacter flagellatus TaxID=1387277 RepID=A0A917E9Z6_9RHOB|nr:hypothetical protein GCM10011360_02780 [Primorskyibacter flagellatus]